jgi:hypothetical protein
MSRHGWLDRHKPASRVVKRRDAKAQENDICLCVSAFRLPKLGKSSYYFFVNQTPKREFQVHNSFAAADEADYAYYRALSGNEKLKLMLKIMAPAYEANPRFERVYRVIERSWR